MSRRVLLTSLVVLTTVQAASADLWPHRKPGLWQTTMTMEGSPMGPITSKFCIDPATESALMNFGRQAVGKMCSDEQVHVSGNSGTIDATCKFGSMTSISHTVITFTGNTSYHSETHSKTEPPPKFGKAERTNISNSIWVGPCPAGMKPGDIVMPNGMKMHFKP